jgi:hypothetical protein
MSIAMSQTAVGTVLNTVSSAISEFFKWFYNQIDNFIYYRLSIDIKESFKIFHSIRQTIISNKLHLKKSNLKLTDSHKGVDVAVNDDSYDLEHPTLGNITLVVNQKDGELTIKTRKIFFPSCDDIQKLVKYINELYNIYNAPCRAMYFFMSTIDKWDRPIIREPRDLSKVELSPVMQELLDDVDQFHNIITRNQYENKGIPYRRGYYLYGKTGTGKSLSAEIISHKYGMSIYMIILNSKDMTDSTLINLCSNVPRHSIILIDEIDKQLDTIKSNVNVSVSSGGLLSALDGAQRLDTGVIVLLTSNRYNILSDDEQKSLLREGRIDKTYEFI